MKYKNLPAEPVGWEPETTCNVQSDYEEDTDEDDQTENEGETEIEVSDQDSERSFRCSALTRKKLEKKSRKRDVVGIILQEDLFFFPEVY